MALTAFFFVASVLPVRPFLFPFLVRKSFKTPAIHKGSTNNALITLRAVSGDPSATDFFSPDIYTDSAWSCIQALPKSATKYNSQYVESSMLLDVVLNEYYDSSDSDSNPARASTNVAETILEAADVDLPRVRQELRQHLDGLPSVSDPSNKIMSASLQKTLKASQAYAAGKKDDFISAEAFVYGLVTTDEFLKKALRRQSVEEGDVLAQVAEQREINGPVTSKVRGEGRGRGGGGRRRGVVADTPFRPPPRAPPSSPQDPFLRAA